MAYLDPNEATKHIQQGAVEGIQKVFPIKGRTHTLRLKSVSVADDRNPDDLTGQHEAKINEKTWASPMHGEVELVDNATGKVVETKKMKLADIPAMTSRYSYIIDGQEYQIDNQWQLKPGVYARRRNNGELEARFNVANKAAFDMVFDPEKKLFQVEYKKAHIPAYPLMKALGVSDADLEASWGKDVFAANAKAPRAATAVEQFYRTATGKAPETSEQAHEFLRSQMRESKLTPDVTGITLGKPFEHVTGEALHRAATKLLSVQKGHPEDDRDSLVFKNLRSAGDYLKEQFERSGREIAFKVQRQLNSPKMTGLRDVIRPDIFAAPVSFVFVKSSISNPAKQINPLDMVSSAMQTTIMGPGGIKSERSITDEAKMINSSHLGFLDAANTPEGSKTGVTLRLPLGVRKDGNTVTIPVYSLKTGKTEYVTPKTFLTSKVVLPDQVEFKNGKPHPVREAVKIADVDNKIVEGKLADADYVMRHPSQLFNLTSNMIPFMQNDSGGRAGMAARHMEQSISLVHREAPLVQVATPGTHGEVDTFEALMGRQAAHHSPVDGTITEVNPGNIKVRDAKGVNHTVHIYNNFPLNDAKSVLHSTPTVKVGDKVAAGGLLADTNYSKGGRLAIGTNLRIAYMPYKGYNFEDGLVISESAAKKLSSVHMHKQSLQVDDQMVRSPREYGIKHVGLFNKDQLGALDTDGVAKVGAIVKPGDPLILASSPYQVKDRTGLAALRKSITSQHVDRSIKWDSDHPGEVVSVHKTGDQVHVHVRTVEPMQIGDKMSNRHGGKGIVTLVLPDKEMPHTKDGKSMDVLFNPTGVGGRMNVGQIIETAAGKIAEKTGKPFITTNFDSKIEDHVAHIKGELDKHGLTDTEQVYDPKTNLPLGNVLVGKQYMMKLVHQVDKKVSARSGMTLPGVNNEEGFDSMTLQPGSGGHAGGQAVGALGMYALLAHGAKANIREMQTLKSEVVDPQTNPTKAWPSQHVDVWKALQEGTPIPTPKPTFAFHRFLQMLRGAGINVEKKGHDFVLGPLTDKHVLQMSAGELPQPNRALQSKADESGLLKPIAGGLFDEKLTGGHGGTKWTHMSLAEPVPNPVFEDAIKRLTGLKGAQFDAIMSGQQGVHPVTGSVTDLKSGVTGGQGIKMLLDKIDVDKELADAKTKLTAAKPADVDRALKKVKYLQALKDTSMKPSEAYVLHHMPILPPSIRPVAAMEGKALRYEDINGLYMQLAQVNQQLKDPVLNKNLTEQRKAGLRSALYDGVKAVTGMTVPENAKQKGLLETLSGTQPKTSYFQDSLINRRQDLTARSTIIPEPSLGLDEVGLPRDMATKLFSPFIVRQLTVQGAAPNTLVAQKMLADHMKGTNKSSFVDSALDRVLTERPILLKRDPVLHRYGIQAFKPKAVDGNAIKIHPLVTSGFNADFDGDTMAVFVPMTHEAVREAHGMFPSASLLNEATGKVMYTPTLDSALGLFKLSRVGKETTHTFASRKDVVAALHSGKLDPTDVVLLSGKKTTPGRVLIAEESPPGMQEKILHDFGFTIDKKGLNTLYTDLASDKYRHEFGRYADKLKTLGFDASYGIVKNPYAAGGHVSVGTHSLSLADFKTDKATREKAMATAHQEVKKLQGTELKPLEKDRQIANVYLRAGEQMVKEHTEAAKKAPSNLFLMTQAGIKPSGDQYKQMAMAPVVLTDSKNRLIPTPVLKSYSEGLDVAGYWTQMAGARRGAVMKVQEVQEPGYMSKLLMNSSMHMVIDKHDCQTNRGIAMSIMDKDIHDRHLASDVKLGGLHLPAGTLLTQPVVDQIRAADKDARIQVRSPLKCESEKGICQKCAGLSVTGKHHALGTNIGVMASQAIGERAVQLTLKSFHMGGVAESGGGSKALNSFGRFEQLTKLHDKIPNSATLAMTSGKVTSVDHGTTGVTVTVNGVKHFIGKDANGVGLHEPLADAHKISGYRSWEPPKIGAHVEAGQVLSDPNRTTINPHDLYAATKSIDKVQNHLTDEIHALYVDEGVRRRAVETLVKAMSNLTKIEDPGGHPHVLRGEFYPTTYIQSLNRNSADAKPIEHTPVIKGVDMLPLSLTTDWMAKLQHQRLKETLVTAASMGHASSIHGPHPIPAAAYGAEFGLGQLAKPSTKPHATEVKPFHY